MLEFLLEYLSMVYKELDQSKRFEWAQLVAPVVFGVVVVESEADIKFHPYHPRS